MTLHLDPILNSPGYFKAQKVRHGAWLPARFWIVEQRDPGTGERIGDDLYRATLAGEPINALEPPNWPFGWQAIEDWEYRHMQEDLEWARIHEPRGALANPEMPARSAERILF